MIRCITRGSARVAAAVPIVLLLVTLGVFEWKAHWAALTGLVAALVVSIVIYGMPAATALGAAVDGAAYGLFPIGWIVLNAVFLYNLTVAAGQFEIVKSSVARLSADRRIQALLVAFSFGAFIEGAAGFGTPVAITAALLNGLGFTPLYSAGLSLIANTAPVAFGAIGTPILTLAAITDIPAQHAERDGRPAAADRLADRPGLAGRDDERLARAARRLAGGARQRRIVRHRPVSRGATTSVPSWWTSSAGWSRSAAWRCSACGGSRAKRGIFRACAE